MSLFFPQPDTSENKPARANSAAESEDTLPVDRPFPKEELQTIARSLSRHTTNGAHVSPFAADENSPLNPASPNFNAREWSKAMLRLRDEDEHNVARISGFAFRNLSAYGYGTSLDFQDTVSNLPWQIAGTVSKLMGNKGERIDILRGMDGLVKAGEMLVVLGPPGS